MAPQSTLYIRKSPMSLLDQLTVQDGAVVPATHTIAQRNLTSNRSAYGVRYMLVVDSPVLDSVTTLCDESNKKFDRFTVISKGRCTDDAGELKEITSVKTYFLPKGVSDAELIAHVVASDNIVNVAGYAQNVVNRIA